MLYDIKLSNHISEGTKVFGTIESKIIFSLTKSSSNYKYMPNEDVIIKTPIKKLDKKKKLKLIVEIGLIFYRRYRWNSVFYSNLYCNNCSIVFYCSF